MGTCYGARPFKESCIVGEFSAFHWIIVALVVLVLFGRGKIAGAMGDFGKGLRAFRQGMKEEDEERERKVASEHPEIAPPGKVTIDAEAKTPEKRD
jgi:sec-independent protein translocase protein TatA